MSAPVNEGAGSSTATRQNFSGGSSPGIGAKAGVTKAKAESKKGK